ncbi:diaminopimelate decarboxylase [Corynebacterium jeikeium]|uniref:diaminopimelate decarboxylase n=1 Tax=Corynebacterium jeikeium TaxID=38289 RepID=UPI0008888F7F|nr:diaminopimelate decarboxylase [Corynebacterium jeikeium]SCX18840.1 Diaminopimelate decarboxylase [Corynebacterium jeikeium]
MDPETHLNSTPLRRRTASTAEFNAIPAHVYPLTLRHETAGERRGEVTIGGVPITEIADTFGTPAFVMDEEDFRTRCRRLAKAFGGGHFVHYASKAFLSKTVARWVMEEGLSLDVASLGELQVALAAGFPAERITVHGNNKSPEFLRLAVSEGAELIVVDSLQEIETLSTVAGELGKSQDVLVRVTPGVHVDTHEFIATSHEDQKFGFSLASGAAHHAAMACHAADGVRLRGLHCHVGSQVFEASGFALAAERLLGLWKQLLDSTATLSDAPTSLDTLDLGGGYGIAYMPDQEALDVEEVASELKSKVRKAAEAAGVPEPKLNVEPGRAIAGPSMITLYRVGTVKDVEVAEGMTRRYISVDGGMSDNIRPALYQAEYDCRVANREVDGELLPTRIVGSHCESGDVLVNDALVPEDVRPGDLLMIGATGAYCYAMASRYNMMTRPPVVRVADGEARLMIRRETIDDVLALEE